MRIVDFQLPSDCRQCPISSIEECIGAGVILWSDPLAFHLPSTGFLQCSDVGNTEEYRKGRVLASPTRDAFV